MQDVLDTLPPAMTVAAVAAPSVAGMVRLRAS